MSTGDAVKICCGDAVGILSLITARISSQGQDVSTTEFERMGGRASSKKWRHSVRVINGDGTTGKLIGDWLTERGLDIKNNRVIRIDEGAPASPRPMASPKSVTQPHRAPYDARRELATPINQKMHSVFHVSKTADSKQSRLAPEPASPQYQHTLQHLQQPKEPTRGAHLDLSAAVTQKGILPSSFGREPALQQPEELVPRAHTEPPAAVPQIVIPPPTYQGHAMGFSPAKMTTGQSAGTANAPISTAASEVHVGSPLAGSTHLGQTSGQCAPILPVHSQPTLVQTPSTGAWAHTALGEITTRSAEPALQTQAPAHPAASDTFPLIVQPSSAPLQAKGPLPIPELPGEAAQSSTPLPVQDAEQSQAAVTAAASQQHLKRVPQKRGSGPPAPMPPAEAGDADLLDHLKTTYIGLIPGDASVELPEELLEVSPASSASERTLIALATTSQEDLMAMSKQSAESPLGALLHNPPGVLVHREAHMTGHRPLKKARATVVPLPADEAAAQIGLYMASEVKDEPWQAFGLSKAPVIGGKQLDLKQLYKAVQFYGGFASCVANKSFAKVTTKLGIDKGAQTNASFLLRGHYTKFLLPYEQQMQILGAAEEAVKKDEGAASDMAHIYTLEESEPTAFPEEMDLASNWEDFIMEEDGFMEKGEVSKAVATAACTPGNNPTNEVIDLVEDSEGDDLAAS